MITCWLLYDCERDSAKADRCEKTNENNVSGIWRGHSLIDHKSSLSYLAHSRDFLAHLLWKEAFNLGSVKIKTNSEESRDRKKHKISAMRDTNLFISLCQLCFGWCHMTKPLFGIVIVWSLLCNRKFPSAVQLKIILCDNFQADCEF